MVVVLAALQAGAQQSGIREGNKLYREGRFEEAAKTYDAVLQKTPEDITAMYNRSNALAKKGDKAGAMAGYDKLVEMAKDGGVQQRSWYDKGVLHQQGQQLEESIAAWKEALKLDPEDVQARENLQKALRERKKQQEEEEKKKKDEPKDKKQQEKQQPQQKQSKLTQKQVEQLLKAMEQKEKEIQKKMQQRAASPSQPEKDW